MLQIWLIWDQEGRSVFSHDPSTHTQRHTQVFEREVQLYLHFHFPNVCALLLSRRFLLIREQRKRLLSTCSRCLFSFCVYYLTPIGYRQTKGTWDAKIHTHMHTSQTCTDLLLYTHTHTHFWQLNRGAFRFQLHGACLFVLHCRGNGVQMRREADCLVTHILKHGSEEVCVITHTHNAHPNTPIVCSKSTDWYRAWLVSEKLLTGMNNLSPLMAHFIPHINSVAVANKITGFYG